MDSIFNAKIIRQDLQDLQDFSFFSQFAKKLRKPNPAKIGGKKILVNTTNENTD